VTVNPLDLVDYNGSIGLPSLHRAVDPDDKGQGVTQLGAPGEMLVRGPQVMKGYWQASRETAKVMHGWLALRTGDIAVCDERASSTSSIARRT
jgi:long-chain acyl-CoA synthetase